MPDPFRRTLISVVPLLAGMALLVVGNGLQTTLIPLRASAEGVSAAAVGHMMSVYYIGFMLGCVLVPRVVQRTGHIRTFATFAAIAATIALVHALYVDPALWAALRGLTGFCFAGLSMVAESWLNERVSNENRGKLNSLYRVVDLAALTGGQALIMVAPIASFELFVLVAIAISLALVPLTLSASGAPAPIPSARLPLGALFRAAPVGVVGCLAIGLANGAFWSLAPLYAASGGRGESFVAAFMGLAVVGGALTAFPIGLLSDRIDRRKVIAGALFATTLAGVALALLSRSAEFALLPVVALYGGAMLPLYSLCVAHTNDRLAAGQFVFASRGLLLVFAIGATLGTTAAAELIGILGTEALFYYVAAIYGLAGLFTVVRVIRRAPAAAAEPVGFAGVPGTTPSAFETESETLASREADDAPAPTDIEILPPDDKDDKPNPSV